MCICLIKPKEVVLTKKLLKTCFENNPHGGGFAFVSNEKLVIEKGFFGFREFWKRFQEIQVNKTMLIHFRVATSGVVDKVNCHPWKIDEHHALIHNGVVANKLGIDSEDFSDTGLFVEHVLKPIFKGNDKIWKSFAFKWTIEQAMGKNNKFVILDNKENFVIFNEKEGEWHNDVWFSNDTYKNARKSLAKLSNSWLEERNGCTVLVKKRGNVTSSQYVKNPLRIESKRPEHLNKIINFAKKQISNDLSRNELSQNECSRINLELEEELARLI